MVSIPDEALTLPAPAFLLLAHMIRIGRDTGEVTAMELVDATGFSKSMILRNTKVLRDAGFVEMDAGAGRKASVIILKLPDTPPVVSSRMPFAIPTLEKTIEVAGMIGVSEELATDCYWHYQKKGWVGIRDLRAALQSWKLNEPKFRKQHPSKTEGHKPDIFDGNPYGDE